MKSTNHLLMWNMSLPDQVFRWHLTGSDATVGNLSIRNSVFMAFSLDKSAIGSDADIRNNHFNDLSLWGSWQTDGVNETTGDPTYTDVTALDYRPALGSILIDRVPSSGRTVVVDIDGTVRPTSTNSTVGPWER